MNAFGDSHVHVGYVDLYYIAICIRMYASAIDIIYIITYTRTVANTKLAYLLVVGIEYYNAYYNYNNYYITVKF